MTMQIEELSNFSAAQWRFLSNPKKYVEESESTDRPLLFESTQRQFLTARDILARLGGCCGESSRGGVLLADDVGLGKTTVAALVAWIFAAAGEKRSVRILAPNDVMVRRWRDELESHVDLLNSCARNLIEVNHKRVKIGAVKRLPAGSIQVVKHSYAGECNNLKCDLLIVDEAHRAKGEGTAFSESLKKQRKKAGRVLILTATPFSIRLDELNRMLDLVGAEPVHGAVRSFSRALEDIYTGSAARNSDEVAKRLVHKASAAIDSISHYVIRHSIDDLPKEHKTLGVCEEWKFDEPAPRATADELELLLRMDRMLRVAKVSGTELARATNDARFHVGWQHFDSEINVMDGKVISLGEPEQSLIKKQLLEIKKLRGEVGAHSKMIAVAKAVAATISKKEKVVIFCHHIATAQELTECLASQLPQIAASNALDQSVWVKAWHQAFESDVIAQQNESLLKTFIEWLCSGMIRAQTESWLGTTPKSVSALAIALRKAPARHSRAKETIYQAALRLFHELMDSNSGKAVLRQNRLELLPGALGMRVLGVCEPRAREELFIRNNQPDTVIKVFGSPFGPDVLVVTDKLSEGIDLHRYCRHLIHYELDPSPIRTVQRNGRIRRVNSWAAITGEKICYAYPAFGGTRDQRLVEIMKKRVATFSLLLGGIQDFDIDSTSAADEIWRSEVVNKAKNQLKAESGKLRAKKPGNEG